MPRSRAWTEVAVSDRSPEPPSPTVSGPDAKRALLKERLAKRLAAAEFPLSYAQRALWFLQSMAPGMASYNVVVVAVATPALDIQALQRALDFVVSRHPALRTVFGSTNGVPTQRVAGSPCQIEVMSVPSPHGKELQARAIEEYRRPFELAEAAMRVVILRAPDRDVFLATVHHIVFDAVSAHVFFNELRAAYEAILEGAIRPQLPTAKLSYRDFVAEQSALLESDHGERLWTYWRERLESLPLPLAFPGRPRRDRFTHEGGSVPFSVVGDSYEALSRLTAERRVTLVSVLLAAYSLLLHRLTGQSDVIVGMPVSGRDRLEWESVIGYFVNMLPLRFSFEDGLSFVDHLLRVSEELRSALAHQQFPFPVMVERLKTRRDLGASPIFQAVLNAHSSRRSSDFAKLFEAGAEPVRFGRSTMKHFPVAQQEGQFDVSCEVVDTGERLEGRIKYGDDVLSVADAEHLSLELQRLLGQIVDRPEAPVSSYLVTPLPPLEQEREQLEI
jgi:NRPS condensation-like uncharacterized protein